MVKKIFTITIIIFSAILAVLDLGNFGIPPTHDGEYHVMRFWQFYKVISEGNLYPRWAPDFNNGFGIPLFNYVYPLPNYVASIFHFLGFGFIDSFKLNMAAATMTGSILMYLWTRKYWGEWGGVVSSVFYTFSPYHLLDIYVRGSVGEVWSLGLAPGLFWTYLNFFKTKKRLYFVMSSIFLALLVLSHNILALIFFGFFIVYAGFLITQEFKNIRGVRTVRELGLIIFVGLGLSAPFWLPALLETKYVVGLQVFDPTQHFPQLYKLIYSSWGYGFSGTNERDQMSFQVGMANLIAVAGSIIILFLSKNLLDDRKTRRIFVFFISLFLITVFLITPFSVFVWKSIPAMGFIQFPWRLLSLAILLISFLAGSLASDQLFKNKSRLQVGIAILLIFISVGFSIKYARAPFYHKRDDQHYLSRENFTNGTNSPGNTFNTSWLSGIPKKEKNKIEIISGLGELKINDLKLLSYSFDVNASISSKAIINTAYFPGWVASINGESKKIENYSGRMILSLNKGKSSVVVFLTHTLAQKLSYIYFLISILLIIFVGHWYAYSNRHKSNK